MAPPNTPGRKKRDNNYFDVGVQGRKTGITLKDTGIRDEHGLEPLSGIFSSPAKPPAKQSARRSNTTLTSSEEMQVGDSSAPEPTTILSERRLMRNGNTIFPPPMGRSPLKTTLGSSPRRPSSAAPPSPERLTNGKKARALSQSAVHRRLDFSMDDSRSSDRSANQSRARVNGVNGKARADVFDLQPSPERSRRARGSSFLAQEQTEADETEPETLVNGIGQSSPLRQVDDDSMQIGQDDDTANPGNAGDESEIGQDTSLMPPPSTRRSGRQRRSDVSATSTQNDAPLVLEAEAAALPKKRGRKPKQTTLAPVEVEEERAPEPAMEEDTVEGESMVAAPAEKKRGRPAKQSKSGLIEVGEESAPEPAVEEDTVQEESVVEAPAEKKRGRARKRPLAEDMAPPTLEERPSKRGRKAAEPEEPARQRRKKPPPSQRDPNARITSAKPAKTSAGASGAESASEAERQRQPGRTRSLQTLRSTTPMEDEGVQTTRAGRASIKPLAWWKGERTEIIYEDGEPVIQGIVRAKDVTPVKRTVRRGASKRKRKIDVWQDEEADGEEEDDWVKEGGGILRAVVRRWDPELGEGVADEDTQEEEIAFAASSIQTRDVPGSNFRYAKTMTLPFFGSGMVDLPPQGYKRSKNSRKMQMVFFVHQGKVTVEVADQVFSIGKGGVWQVPRGNFYSIANEGDKLARIFFAQGCEMEAQQGVEGEGE